MATKSTILSTINGFITAIITQAKHRSSMSTIVDEMYQNVVTDSNVDETYTTNGASLLDYSITIHKSGNVGRIKGSITNNELIAIGNVSLFDFNNTEYKPKNFVNNFKLTAINDITTVLCTLGSTFTVNGSIPSGETVEFEYITYITQD